MSYTFTMQATFSFHASDDVIEDRRPRLSRHALALLACTGGRRNGDALDEIAARQRAADEKRKEEAGRRQQDAAVSQSALVQ